MRFLIRLAIPSFVLFVFFWLGVYSGSTVRYSLPNTTSPIPDFSFRVIRPDGPFYCLTIVVLGSGIRVGDNVVDFDEFAKMLFRLNHEYNLSYVRIFACNEAKHGDVIRICDISRKNQLMATVQTLPVSEEFSPTLLVKMPASEI
jgi:hypothetical protein